MDPQDDVLDQDTNSKSPVVRGARACTVCRAAKMKCVGADDGEKQCQRCKRANVECIFEKHRRGRKPGSKLSEASKMLRRLEKGLNTAKLKSQVADQPYGADARDPYLQRDPYSATASHFPSNELPPLNIPPYQNCHGSRSIDMDDADDDPDPEDRALFPAKLIRKENQRNSFFRTILNPPEAAGNPNGAPHRPSFSPPHQNRAAPYNDPISTGIIDEDQAKVLFDLIFLRLNPFINLFDPALHSVHYVRSKCPFLFTTLIMAGCKFFKPEVFKPCQKLAHELAVRAFAEAWKRVEVVQAFACLTYWKDPDDNRTWTYIGYACRMAVELGLNRYHSSPPPNESEFQMLERRNRERTYLVLFTHDRSLSTQTGRNWMLPEDEFVRHSVTWHEEAGNPPRPEDVIVAAFVQLRRISAETTDMFYSKTGNTNGNNDVNYEVVLRNCNGKLTQWMDNWQAEMQRAGGESFHFSFLSFFRLHVRLFLNSFGIQASLAPSSRASPSLQALSACCTSALDNLRIVSKDFPSMSMLRYGQDSITVMCAYSAVFLLKLLRSSNTLAQLHEGTAHEIHSLISKTADAYYDASVLSPASTSAAYHARFLRSLLANDIFKVRRGESERYDSMPIDPRLQAPTPTSIYPPQQQISPSHDQQTFQFPTSPTNISAQPEESPTARNGTAPLSAPIPVNYHPEGYVPSIPHHASELDAHYWKNMFLELGFGDDQSRNLQSAADSHQLPYHMHHAVAQANYGH
ncbi:fungal-specific transcription factor domain-containing protein [Mycena metata]|uniref:Fungal-specific transcription factor domain-containing protein n=1 Tax=Mycena metata TaxID=1033252 RepID=A0AAD7J0G6_9AGAR|nr:fungal-specific transcription factor domain-containing protein [Mycena metata]